jgi:predicted ATPase/DNA-binding CsgD family transcriptional regulator
MAGPPVLVAGNLPVTVTKFVGRRREIADARRLIGESRLVTLTGVGGVGKTRLALEVAAQVRRAFPDGTWVADLSAVEDPAQVAHAVASALGVMDQSTRPMTGKVIAHLANATALLILDNCEHLCEACAVFADHLLTRTRAVRILATSRQALGIPGEQLFAVPPLSLPGPAGVPDPAALSHYDAVTLLADRVAALQPAFAITSENGPAVARLCGQLDGLPLAIELAASRLRSLSPAQLADRLEHSFALLARGSAVAAARQQTLQAVFDWSYSLCSPAERLLWARLSAFAGPFDLDAAEGVCAGDGLAADAILDLLDRLVAQSIVLAEPHRGQVRFRLLETIRQYGRERLAAAGGEPALRQRHRDYYLHLAQRVAADWCSPRQAAGLARLRDNHGNLWSALETSVADPAGPASALALVSALRHHWSVDGCLAEGRTWLDQVLALPRAGAAGGGPAGARQDDSEQAARAHALWVAAWVSLLQGDDQAGRARLDECEALAAFLGDRRAAGFACSLRGTAELFAGHAPEAIKYLAEAVAIFENAGDTEGLLWAMFQLAGLRSDHSDSERAQRICGDALAISEAHGERLCRSYTLWVLGIDLWLQGDPGAASRARDALALQRGFNDPVGAALIIDLLAWIATSRGEMAEAARLFGISGGVCALVGTAITDFGPGVRKHREACLARVRAWLGTKDLPVARLPTVAAAIAAVLEQPAAPARASGPLTAREREIAGLVAEGLSNRAIAARLVISHRTVDGHMERILAKLGFTSRAQVAAWAAAEGG